MILNNEDQTTLLTKLQEELSELEFGRIYCNLVVSDRRLMYVDFKQEKSKRVYFHTHPNNNTEEGK